MCYRVKWGYVHTGQLQVTVNITFYKRTDTVRFLGLFLLHRPLTELYETTIFNVMSCSFQTLVWQHQTNLCCQMVNCDLIASEIKVCIYIVYTCALFILCIKV